MTASKAKLNGRPSFLVLKDQIKEELEAGVFATRIYAKHKDRLPFSYRQFLYYIDQYGLQPAPGGASVTAGAQPGPTAGEKRSGLDATRMPIVTEPEQPRKFVFDPANIDKKNLI